MRRLSIVLVLLAIAAPAAAQPPAEVTPVIVTSGEGVVKQAPDRAWVTIAAETRAATAQEAQRVNAIAMKGVNDQLKAAGIAADAITTTGFNLQPDIQYANGKQTVRGYIARNQVQVRVDALPTMGQVIAIAVATGATNVSGIRFDLKDREKTEREALQLAVHAARARADAIAAAAGVQIDRVMRIDQQDQPSNIVVTNGLRFAGVAETAAVQAVPIEAGEIEIHARVTMTVVIRPKA